MRKIIRKWQRSINNFRNKCRYRWMIYWHRHRFHHAFKKKTLFQCNYHVGNILLPVITKWFYDENISPSGSKCYWIVFSKSTKNKILSMLDTIVDPDLKTTQWWKRLPDRIAVYNETEVLPYSKEDELAKCSYNNTAFVYYIDTVSKNRIEYLYTIRLFGSVCQ